MQQRKDSWNQKRSIRSLRWSSKRMWPNILITSKLNHKRTCHLSNQTFSRCHKHSVNWTLTSWRSLTHLVSSTNLTNHTYMMPYSNNSNNNWRQVAAVQHAGLTHRECRSLNRLSSRLWADSRWSGRRQATTSRWETTSQHIAWCSRKEMTCTCSGWSCRQVQWRETSIRTSLDKSWQGWTRSYAEASLKCSRLSGSTTARDQVSSKLCRWTNRTNTSTLSTNWAEIRITVNNCP